MCTGSSASTPWGTCRPSRSCRAPAIPVARRRRCGRRRRRARSLHHRTWNPSSAWGRWATTTSCPGSG
uniref:Uncharacterized protein n=1 Tax=Arundo donax TaxID=35708 RepID=A0A0A9H5K2_ARUDO